MVFSARINVLGLMLVIHEQRYRAYRAFAVFEEVHHRISVLIEGQPVMYLHPSGKPFVVSLLEIDLMFRGSFGDGFACLRVPYRGIGNSLYLFAFEPSVFGLDAVYFGEDLIGSPLDSFVRSLRASV